MAARKRRASRSADELTRAGAVIEFIEKFLLVPEGARVGKPVELLVGPQLGRPAEGHAAYIGAAVEQIRKGTDVDPHDTARLSPLIHEHINFLGRYVFTLPEPIAKGRLRPLRTPALVAGLRAAL